MQIDEQEWFGVQLSNQDKKDWVEYKVQNFQTFKCLEPILSNQ